MIRQSLRMLQWGRRFSAAEIPDQPRLAHLEVLASMGPPLFSGGNGNRIHQNALDWTCFNGAAAFQRRKFDAAGLGGGHSRWLQWGRRFSAAEIGHEMSQQLHCFDASMGPPLFSGGNRHHGRAEHPLRRASMGPPLFSGGNGETHGHRHGVCASLQWGRRFSAAEIPQRARHQELASDPSMGPPLFSGGNARGPCHTAARPRAFNGAAAFQRRKLGIRPPS